MTDIDWTKLAEAFPEDDVKHRPGAATYDHKSACEGNRCRDTRDATKHIQFSYVDARTVAQRLDEVLTPLGWSFVCQHIGEGVVHGRLSIGDSVREDHGYPNSDRDEEPIKAATSDALKRCAVLFGIGRHLYDDNKPGQRAAQRPTTARSAPPPPRAPARAPVTSAGNVAASIEAALDGEPEWPSDFPDDPPHLRAVNGPAPVPPTNVQTDRPEDPRDGHYGDTCPKHVGRPWKDTPYGAKCTAKDDDGKNGYCIWKPSKRWVAEHETVPA